MKIAQVLCRIGLHLSPSSVGRYLRETYRPPSAELIEATQRVIRAKGPVHALPQRWPFCWWVAAAVDHHARRAMGAAVFLAPPASVQVRAFLGRAIRRASKAPKRLIPDQGSQFTDDGFRRWCRRRGIRQRFGAVGKYGSVSVVERFIRTMKDECTRRLLVPYRRDAFRRELLHFIAW